MTDNQQSASKGFTLIELLTVIGIIFLLLTIGFPSYNAIRQNVALENYTQEIVNALRLAQSRSITSLNNTRHGVHFDPNGYVLYGGEWSAPDYETPFGINSGIVISEGFGDEVVFDRLTGTTTDQTIEIGFPSGNQKTIQIDAVGKISIL